MIQNQNSNLKTNYSDNAFNALSESIFELGHIITNKNSVESIRFEKLCMAVPCLSYDRFNRGNLPDFNTCQQQQISTLEALKPFINSCQTPNARTAKSDRRYWDNSLNKKDTPQNNLFIYSLKLEHLLAMDMYVKRQLSKGKNTPQVFDELKHMSESGYRPVAKKYLTKIFSAKKQLSEAVAEKKALNQDNCRLMHMLNGLHQTLTSDNSWYSEIISKQPETASITKTAHHHLLKQIDNSILLTNNLIDLSRQEKQLSFLTFS